MFNADFTKYSLVLIKNGRIIFSSTESGLIALIKCIDQFKDLYNGCFLVDKVVGLAAARLIVYSKMISQLHAGVASKSALKFLRKKDITVKAKKVVNNILNKDRSYICPMELEAQTIKDVKLLYLQIKGMYRYSY